MNANDYAYQGVNSLSDRALDALDAHIAAMSPKQRRLFHEEHRLLIATEREYQRLRLLAFGLIAQPYLRCKPEAL